MNKNYNVCPFFSTVKFEKTDTDDNTHNFEEVQNSSGTKNGMNKLQTYKKK